MNFLRKDSDSSRPSRHRQNWQDHPWHDTTVHPHHHGPFGVLFHITGAMLDESNVSFQLRFLRSGLG